MNNIYRVNVETARDMFPKTVEYVQAMQVPHVLNFMDFDRLHSWVNSLAFENTKLEFNYEFGTVSIDRHNRKTTATQGMWIVFAPNASRTNKDSGQDTQVAFFLMNNSEFELCFVTAERDGPEHAEITPQQEVRAATEMERLADRFIKLAAKGLVDVKFDFRNTDDATTEDVAREVNAMMDALERGEANILDFKDRPEIWWPGQDGQGSVDIDPSEIDIGNTWGGDHRAVYGAKKPPKMTMDSVQYQRLLEDMLIVQNYDNLAEICRSLPVKGEFVYNESLPKSKFYQICEFTFSTVKLSRFGYLRQYVDSARLVRDYIQRHDDPPAILAPLFKDYL